MVKCPKCGKEVSFINCIKCIFPLSPDLWRNYIWNVKRGKAPIAYRWIYTCDNCNAKFSTTLGSWFLIVALFSISSIIFLGVILLLFPGFLTGPLLVFIFAIIWLISIGLVFYVWWHYLAESREPYLPKTHKK